MQNSGIFSSIYLSYIAMLDFDILTSLSAENYEPSHYYHLLCHNYNRNNWISCYA
jgi:hypothetical protein